MIVSFRKWVSIYFGIFSFYFAHAQDKKQQIDTTALQKEIEAVTITGKKKLIERKVDRLVFNVENSISAQGGDALDALKVTPTIRIRKDQLSIIGKNGVLITIDDRPIKLAGEDVLNYLKSIPTSSIQSIEVISNPPSKYDAEGNSGVINIKLKKNRKDDLSGNIRSSFTQATYGLGSLDGSLNYQRDKLTVNFNLNYINGSTAPYQEFTVNYPNFKWFEVNTKRVFQNNFTGGFNIDYEISKKTTIGAIYSISTSNPLRKGNTSAAISNYSNSRIDSLIITPSRLKVNKDIHSFNFHTITKIDSLGKKISADIDYFKFNSTNNNFYNSSTYLVNESTLLNSLEANNLSDQNISIYSGKIDYDIPLSYFDISIGGKLSFIVNKSSTEFYKKKNEAYYLDPLNSNKFDYKENTQALYVSGSKKINEKISVKAGLRGESTQVDGYSITYNQSNKNNYFKVFPSLYFTFSPKEDISWSLNYNKRISRPSYGQLNPFRYYSSAYNYGEGNPFLQPYITHNFEISNLKGNNYLSLYSSVMKNAFDEVTFILADGVTQRVTPINFINQLNFGLLDNYTLRKWKFWESNNTLNIFYTKTYSNIENIKSLEKVTFSLTSNNSFTLNKRKTISGQLDLNWQTPSIANSYNLSGFFYCDLGVKFLFDNNHLQLGINFLDVFKTNKLIFNQVVNNISQKSYEYQDSQKLRVSLNWNFGKKIKSTNRKLSNEDEKKRAK